MILCPIHESNDCHTPAGSPEGGQFCSAGYLRGEASRARKLGIAFTADSTLNVRGSGFYKGTRFDPRARIEIGLGSDEWALNRAGILSVARHELGHATDPQYGYERRAQRIIAGQEFSHPYAEEFGAWRAAIRDSGGRVQWRTVRQSLTNYLSDDTRHYQAVNARLAKRGVTRDADEARWEAEVARDYDRTLDRHIALLKRYARHVRGGRKKAT